MFVNSGASLQRARRAICGNKVCKRSHPLSLSPAPQSLLYDCLSVSCAVPEDQSERAWYAVHKTVAGVGCLLVMLGVFNNVVA